MTTIELYEQDGNQSIGIYQENDGIFLALSFASSRRFKTLKGAKKWIAKYL
jgi:hypothetical protein